MDDFHPSRNGAVASGALDPGSHLAGHQFDLPSLVAQRPKVDALASRRGVVGEKSRAVLSRADAKLASKLVGARSLSGAFRVSLTWESGTLV
jgi:hypothetical protein